MKQDDFMFTVGYNGDESIVNKQTEMAGKGLSVKELVDKGLFKPALCASLMNDDKDGIKYLMDTYNKISGSNYHSEMQIMRLFGVYSVPDKITKVKRL
ncbi:hypothetical protein EW093_05905 [Thiospirochaeta perfilievii]|uniref:Uncharacterized protein n=1 Tax=Thiospirochaeta perfilievii TaxID=252967 RepID=A0A5C1Q9U2_9SPIO|nr:hypothetical protein [Thiospirochaeta perfilievii]QEN04251.1 hypothetical protein EW093_05905 [Thiospirochaeta perfilievii]